MSIRRLWSNNEKHRLESLKEYLANNKTKRQDLLEAAVFAPNEELRLFMILKTAEKKVELKTGMNDYHIAAISGDMKYFRRAEENGADYKAVLDTSKSKSGYSSELNGLQPIHLAAQLNRVEVLQALIDKGADVNTGGMYRLPLALALSTAANETAQVLIESGANVNKGNTLQRICNAVSAAVIDLLVEHKAQIRNEDLIKVLVRNNAIDVLQHLSKHGMKWKFKDGTNALFETLNSKACYDRKQYEALLDFLIQQGLDINQVCECDFDGKIVQWTLLADAIQFFKDIPVEVLLERGAVLPDNIDLEELLCDSDHFAKKVKALLHNRVKLESEVLCKKLIPALSSMGTRLMVDQNFPDNDLEELKKILRIVSTKPGFTDITINGYDLLFSYIAAGFVGYQRPDPGVVGILVNAGCKTNISYITDESDMLQEINEDEMSGVRLMRNSYNSAELVADWMKGEDLTKEILSLLTRTSGENIEIEDAASSIRFGFDDETFAALIYGIYIESVDYEIAKSLSELCAENKVDFIPCFDLSNEEDVVEYEPSCVIGTLVQSVNSWTGPEKVLKENIAAAKSGFTEISDEFQQKTSEILGRELLHLKEKASLYLCAAGPLAFAILASGELGCKDDEAYEGDFISGQDMNQEPHYGGVWGNYNNDTDTCSEVTEEQLETPDGKSLFLIARYD